MSEQMRAADQVRKALERHLETINKVPAALLYRAFNGSYRTETVRVLPGTTAGE